MAGSFKLADGHVEIRADTSRVDKQVRGIERSSASASMKAGTGVGARIAAGIGSALTGAAAVTVGAAATGIGIALTKGFSRLQGLDQARAKLTGLGHDAATVDLVMSNALDSVRGTAFGLDAAATVGASAIAAGIAPGQDLTRTLKLVADAATIAGVDMQSMGAIFNKAAASNKVQMDVINQLHDAGVPALAFLAKQMGVTAEEASKMASEGKIDFATFQAAMEAGLGGAAMSSGNTFTGAMANVMAALGRVGANFMGGVFPKMAPLFQAVSAALGPIEERAKGFGEAVAARVNPFIDKLVGLLENGLPSFGAISGILGPATAAFAALGAKGLAPLVGQLPLIGGLGAKLGLLGGPVGIAIAAFAGLAATSPQLQSALQGILSAVGEVVAALGPRLAEIATALQPLIAALLPTLVDILSTAAGVVAGIVSGLAPFSDVLIAVAGAATVIIGAMKTWAIVSAAVTAAQWLLNVAMTANPIGIVVVAIGALIAAIVLLIMNWDTVVAFLTSTWEGFVGWITGVMEGFASWWDGIWSGIVGWFTDTFGPAINGAVMIFQAAVLGFQIIGAAISAWWTELWSGITAFLREHFGPGIELVVSLFELAGLLLMAAGKILSDWWTSLWSGIVQWATDTFSPFISWIVSTFQTAVAGWQIIGAALSAWWSSLWQGIAQWAIDTFGPGIRAVVSIFNTAKAGLTAAGNALGSWWSGLWSNITGWIGGAVSAIAGKIGEVIGFFTSLRDRIWGAVSGFATMLVRAGSDLVAGLVQGIRNSIGGVLDVLIGGVHDAIAGVKDFLGIKSPSRLFRDEIGKMLGEGMAIGIDAKVNRVEGAGIELAEAAQRGASADLTVNNPVAAAVTATPSTSQTVIEQNITVSIDGHDLRSMADVVALFQGLAQANRAQGGQRPAVAGG